MAEKYQISQLVRSIDPLIELIQILNAVKTDTPEAELNEISMIDNNGRRIKY